MEAVVSEFYIWSEELECVHGLSQDQQRSGRLAQQDQLQDEFQRTCAILPPPPKAVQGSHCHPHASQAPDGRKTGEVAPKAGHQTEWKAFPTVGTLQQRGH